MIELEEDIICFRRCKSIT